MRYSHFVRTVLSYSPQSTSAGAEAFTTGVDCRGYRRARVLLVCGTATATGTIAAANVQDSADNSTYADVTGADFDAITTSNDNTIHHIDVDLTQRARYLRVAYDVDTDAVIFGVVVELWDPINPPATNSSTEAASPV